MVGFNGGKGWLQDFIAWTICIVRLLIARQEEGKKLMAASIQDELIPACQQSGCPLCRLVQAGVQHYL
jgi:hypothetical protein